MDIKELSNLRILRAKLRGHSVKEINAIINKLNALKQEFAAKKIYSIESDPKKADSIKIIQGVMTENSLSLEELNAVLKENNRKKMAPKYRYIGLDGLEYTWSGQGKLPKTLKALLDSTGKNKEDYRIKEE